MLEDMKLPDIPQDKDNNKNQKDGFIAVKEPKDSDDKKSKKGKKNPFSKLGKLTKRQ